jgi:hypothetical protein
VELRWFRKCGTTGGNGDDSAVYKLDSHTTGRTSGARSGADPLDGLRGERSRVEKPKPEADTAKPPREAAP